MKYKFSLDDLYLFQMLVQHQGINAAADVTGVPAATLSRRLKRLEQDLGCRLLERSAHRFALTEMGHRYYAECQPLLTDLQAVTEALDVEQHSLQGSLKITTPVNLGQHWLRDCFFAFAQQYPQIRLELVLSNHLEPLVDNRFDAAFRIGDPHEQDWIARHIFTTHMVLCATSAYLQQSPPLEHPRDLLQQRLILVDPTLEWDLRHQLSGEEFMLQPAQPVLRTNDFNLAVDALRAGMGISLIPSYYLSQPSMLSAQLEPLLPAWRGRCRRLFLLYRDRQTMSARLRVFVDFVVDWMNQQQLEQDKNTPSP